MMIDELLKSPENKTTVDSYAIAARLMIQWLYLVIAILSCPLNVETH